MKTLSVISLSIMLAACGGESSETKSELGSNQDQGNGAVVEEKLIATYENALKRCGDGLVLSFDDLLVNGSSEKISVKSKDDNSEVVLSGTSSDVCVEGNVLSLSVSGSSVDVYISGSVESLSVSGSSADIYIFGSISSAVLDGSSNKIYTQEVATYTDSGTNNDIMNISNAEL